MFSKTNSLEKEFKLNKTKNIIDFIDKNFKNYSLDNIFLIAEHSNSERLDTSAYFTRKDIAYSVVKDLPELKKKKKIRIIEPSVGVGNFLPLLFEKYQDKDEVVLDVCDIDNNSLKILKIILSKIKVPKNFKIKYIHSDFLLLDFETKYDIVVGNPPFGKVSKNKNLLDLYKTKVYNSNTNNIFSFFIEKSLKLGDTIALIVPKSLLNSPEFDKTRKLLKDSYLQKICDYGEKAFKGVKIETISFLCSNSVLLTENIVIESYIKKSYNLKRKSYIFDEKFPSWLIYREIYFDQVAFKMKLGVFDSFNLSQRSGW